MVALALLIVRAVWRWCVYTYRPAKFHPPRKYSDDDTDHPVTQRKNNRRTKENKGKNKGKKQGQTKEKQILLSEALARRASRSGRL